METPSKDSPISADRLENQLLISVARRTLHPSGAERVSQLLREDLDWHYIITTANRHGVIPLLYHHLNSLAARVPPEIHSDLRYVNYEISRTNLFLAGELIKLLQFLQARDVHVIPFKGPVLALWAYGDSGLRQFVDLDLLVRQVDVLKVAALLGERGFKWEEFTPIPKATVLRFGYACNLKNDSGVILDLHWRLVERYHAFDIGIDQLWDRLKPVNLAGREIMTLSAEDLLIVLCLHGFTHSWERLGWITDVAGLLQHGPGIDWDRVLKNAEKMGVTRVVALGLLLAKELLEARVPSSVDSTLEDEIVAEVAAQVRRHLFAGPNAMPKPDLSRSQVRMRERVRDKIRTGWRLVFTPRVYDYTYWSVSQNLWFLHYPARQLRLFAKFGSKLMNARA